LVLGALLGIWTANALYVLSTVSAQAARTASSSDEQHAPSANWWGRFNRDLRASMAAVDQAMDIPPRRQNFSFWLFIGLPGLISIACLVKSLPTFKAKTAPRISGEVTWPRSAFDPGASGGASIEDLIRVSANLVQTGGPPNGTYDVLTPIAVAKLGKPYRKFEYLMAVPFSIDGLPLETELALDCAVAKELRNHSPEGVRLGGTIHSSRITLTGETPTAGDITLELSCFDR
jgi:hypothetical protein